MCNFVSRSDLLGYSHNDIESHQPLSPVCSGLLSTTSLPKVDESLDRDTDGSETLGLDALDDTTVQYNTSEQVIEEGVEVPLDDREDSLVYDDGTLQVQVPDGIGVISNPISLPLTLSQGVFLNTMRSSVVLKPSPVVVAEETVGPLFPSDSKV